MSKLIDLTIDGKRLTVPAGTLIVDAAKQAGIDIPVFCYHPKLKPAGMCRMCLVEVGRPSIDRATGQPLLQADGKSQIQFGLKLETACTTPVSQGMIVLTSTNKVKAARKDILEFLLSSHPLDCPVCDKGGECPLQNLTLLHGPGESRFLFDEKMHLAKHVPLGELIYLDRERCIQCGRCVRFQTEVVDDPVIALHNRGRSFEIVSHSDPGFDSYFSGNTTDICPVGALTTADFRFGARPWELNAAASLCPHCPVGCNLTFNVRREAASGGRVMIKRVMPRQNEAVNEIWICDKGRLAYHYTEAKERLTTPLIRKNGELTPASWDEALDLVAGRFHTAGENLLVLAGGRLPNEDLFNLHRLAEAARGAAVLYTHMAGGELTTQLGATAGMDFGQMGKGTVILVVASNLHEEAPIWYLRVKQATERGAILIVANARPTRLDRYAAHTIRYTYGEEANTVLALAPGRQPASSALAATTISAATAITNAAAALASAAQTVMLFGSDGLGLVGSQALASACADLIHNLNSSSAASAKVDSPQATYSLIGVWPHANDQGAWELGFHTKSAHKIAKEVASALYVVAADPFGDEAGNNHFLSEEEHPLAAGRPFMVVQELFLTPTALRADVVLPAQAFTEREGTFTSGERRVQRFYPAVPAHPGCRPDYAITAEIGKRMGLSLEGRAPAAVFAQISTEISAFNHLSYRKLAETTPQWPAIGTSLSRKGLYFSGTGYENKQGLGVHLALPSAHDPVKTGNLVGLGDGTAQTNQISDMSPFPHWGEGAGDRGINFLAVPVTCLYDGGQTVWPTSLLRTRGGNRPGKPWVALNPEDAARLDIHQDQFIKLEFSGSAIAERPAVMANLDLSVPAGIILVPRSFGLGVNTPTEVLLNI
jgi:NADH-quinone oxidoreductase subunit G